MFERYTENARRAIFFARYESSQFGTPYIETEHILLGVVREDRHIRRLLRRSLNDIHRLVEQETPPGKKTSTSVDLPLSKESKRVLEHAAQQAETMGDRHIGTEHLFLGLLLEPNSLAAGILRELDIRLDVVREQLRAQRSAPPAESSGLQALPFSKDLTEQASEDLLPPLVGRQTEMERLIQVLGRADKRCAVLVGQIGVGRKAIIGGLAQRIARRQVPDFLADKKVIASDFGEFVRSPRPGTVEIRVSVGTLGGPQHIFFFDELFRLLMHPQPNAFVAPTHLLKSALLDSKLQCMTVATPEEARETFESLPWLERCFSIIDVPECSPDEALEILNANRSRLETFHDVTYTSEAIKAAVLYSTVLLKDRFLPDKAIDVLDEAGAYKKAEPVDLPRDIIEARKRLRFIGRQTENAVANHEFEKARFYSDEERKEREALEELYRKHNLDQKNLPVITPEVVEQALARRIGTSLENIRKARSPEST
ncbi:MAG TPA: Clp protease N-terminal domain-containing protein [Candidatus Angelobacter sp.]|nr:Clp protease N-terminal domain-containing protein [Candidatus Angelobacter sp.]